jgi:hypothetical protein
MLANAARRILILTACVKVDRTRAYYRARVIVVRIPGAYCTIDAVDWKRGGNGQEQYRSEFARCGERPPGGCAIAGRFRNVIPM